MSQSWPMVPLGTVATPVQRPVTVVLGQSYRTLGVKWWGEGAYERDTIDGSATAAATLYEVHADDLIINKIWVRHGSVAIAGPQIHGCAGSNKFPTFALYRVKALPRWIHWYTKTRDLWQKCDVLSQGTSGKNRIRPERFLTVTIPLPPLPEQRRIVAKIDELAAKIGEARGCRSWSMENTGRVLRSAINELSGLMNVDGTLGGILVAKPRNGWSPRCDNSENGTAVLALGAVTGFRYNGVEYKRTSLPASPGAHYWLCPGDLLITRSNTPELVGHAAIYDGSPAPCIYPDLMMRLCVDLPKGIPALSGTGFRRHWCESSLRLTQLEPAPP